MFDVAPAFQKPRRKTARSRKPTPIHFKSSLTCWMSATPAFEHCRLLTKFSAFSFHFAFWLTTLVFKRGRWSQRSPVLRSSASSCWACFCLFLLGTLARCLRGLEIVWHCITQAIKRKSPSTVSCDAFQISIHSFKEPLSLSLLLPVADCRLPSGECVSLVLQDGRWEKEDADAEINRGTSMSTAWSKQGALLVASHHFLKSWFGSVHQWGLTATGICSPTSRALSRRDCWCLASSLLNLFDRACWTRPLISACKEAGV